MTEVDKAAVDAELQQKFKEKEAEEEVKVVVKTMIQSLTKETLLRLALGDQTEVDKASVARRGW